MIRDQENRGISAPSAETETLRAEMEDLRQRVIELERDLLAAYQALAPSLGIAPPRLPARNRAARAWNLPGVPQ